MNTPKPKNLAGLTTPLPIGHVYSWGKKKPIYAKPTTAKSPTAKAYQK
jgi:hypothetical protein